MSLACNYGTALKCRLVFEVALNGVEPGQWLLLISQPAAAWGAERVASWWQTGSGVRSPPRGQCEDALRSAGGGRGGRTPRAQGRRSHPALGVGRVGLSSLTPLVTTVAPEVSVTCAQDHCQPGRCSGAWSRMVSIWGGSLWLWVPAGAGREEEGLQDVFLVRWLQLEDCTFTSCYWLSTFICSFYLGGEGLRFGGAARKFCRRAQQGYVCLEGRTPEKSAMRLPLCCSVEKVHYFIGFVFYFS